MSQPEMSKGYQLSFKLFHDGVFAREEALSVHSVTIGRLESNIIKLDNENIADLHAVIKLTKDQRLIVMDLDSDDGTYINGQRVDSRMELPLRARVGVGPFELSFDLTGVEEPANGNSTKTRKHFSVDAGNDSATQGGNGAATQGGIDAATQGGNGTATQGGIDAVVSNANAISAFAVSQSEDATPPTGYDAEAQSLLALRSEEVVKLLFDAWDSKDQHNIDNRTAGKVIEIFEVWGDTILSAKQFPRTIERIRVADSYQRKPDFFVPTDVFPGDQFSILLQINGTPHLCFTDKFEGTLFQGGQALPLADLITSGAAKTHGKAYAVMLTEDSRFVVHLGHVVLVGAFSLPARTRIISTGWDFDPSLLSLLLVFGLLIGSATVYMRSLPPPEPMSFAEIPDRFAEIILPEKEKVEKKEEKKKLEVKTSKPKPDVTPPPKPVEDRGKKDSKIKIRKSEKVAMDQAAADKAAANKALEGLIGNQGLGRGFGPDTRSGVAGLLGTTASNSAITGVRASRGLGFGGGDGAGGIGRLGTKGGGDGDYGKGQGYKRRKTRGSLDAGGSDTVILGALDKSIIDKVIKDHIQEIRYCYQRALPRNPRLAGKVVVRFTINGHGSVSQSTIRESTMGNGSVEGCINQRIQSLIFPEPKGRGRVIVVYPFFFKAAG